MLPRSIRVAGLAVLLLAACTTSPASRPHSVPARSADALLLISIDGLRAGYLGHGDTPHLERIAAQGVRARWMTPSYPVLTFPNHYTLVTGLRPDHHGMVHNSMRENGLGEFRVADRGAVGDGRWWSGAEPVWVSAEKAGLPTANWAWPGSAAEIRGVRPTRWMAYDESVSAHDRADQVLAWLSEPGPTRPRLATLYFEMVDKAGHEHGPDSAQAHAAVREVDAAIGRLVDGLRARGLLQRVNVVVVSDHGMAPVSREHVMTVDDMVAEQDATVVSIGQVVGFEPRVDRRQAAEQRLLGRHDHYQCWRKQELPAQWRYGRNPRVASIVCQMDEGWDAVPTSMLQARRTAGPRGSHGYEPQLESMRAVFIAQGPAFRQGAVIPAFDNVDVYPLLVRLLGIEGRPNDGDLRPLLPALQQVQAQQH